MSTLVQSDWPAFERRLQQRHQDLRAAIHVALLRSDEERYQDIAGVVHDTEEQSIAHLLAGVSLAEISRELQELQQVEAALRRMGLGTYGRCVTCGEPIERERLEAHPSATRCLHCQQGVERVPAGRTPSSG